MRQSIYATLLLLLLAITSSQGYSETLGIEPGDIVDLEYEGKLEEDGNIFDAGRIQDAMIVEGQFIEGFYNGVLGMKVGETKVITIPPEEGYATDPSHELYGKTLIFTVYVYAIVSDIRPETLTEDGSDNVSTSASLPITFNFVLFSLIVAIPLPNRYRSD